MARRTTAVGSLLAWIDRSAAARYGSSVLLVIAAGLARGVLLPTAGDRSPYLLFVLAVFLAGLVGGFGPGLTATVLAAAAAALLYLEPIGQPAIGAPGDVARTAIFLVEGLVFAVAGAAAHRFIEDRASGLTPLDRARSLLRLEGVARRAGAPPAYLVESLTRREKEVIRLAALGLRNDEIAESLDVSKDTVKTHLAHAFGKLGVRNRAEAVARAASLGLFDEPQPDAESGTGPST